MNLKLIGTFSFSCLFSFLIRRWTYIHKIACYYEKGWVSSCHIFAFSSTGMSENSRARGNPKEAFDYVAHVLPNVSHILKLSS